MPRGSPGMEAGGKVQPYKVIAFGNGRREVFASYTRFRSYAPARQRRQSMSCCDTHHANHAQGEATAIDPVCGMSVTIEGAMHTAGHDGATHYFCSARCKDKFVADPEHYLSGAHRSEEHTSELQSLMRISYAVFCLKKKKQ